MLKGWLRPYQGLTDSNGEAGIHPSVWRLAGPKPIGVYVLLPSRQSKWSPVRIAAKGKAQCCCNVFYVRHAYGRLALCVATLEVGWLHGATLQPHT